VEHYQSRTQTRRRTAGCGSIAAHCHTSHTSSPPAPTRVADVHELWYQRVHHVVVSERADGVAVLCRKRSNAVAQSIGGDELMHDDDPEPTSSQRVSA
jgi:hypothetical protein